MGSGRCRKKIHPICTGSHAIQVARLLGGGPEMRTKIPDFGLFRNQISACSVIGHENCDDFDSETSMMTVVLLANSRA